MLSAFLVLQGLTLIVFLRDLNLIFSSVNIRCVEDFLFKESMEYNMSKRGRTEISMCICAVQSALCSILL